MANLNNYRAKFSAILIAKRPQIQCGNFCALPYEHYSDKTPLNPVFGLQSGVLLIRELSIYQPLFPGRVGGFIGGFIRRFLWFLLRLILSCGRSG